MKPITFISGELFPGQKSNSLTARSSMNAGTPSPKTTTKKMIITHFRPAFKERIMTGLGNDKEYPIR